MKAALILLLLAVVTGIAGNACLRHARHIPDGYDSAAIGMTFLFVAAVFALVAVLKGFS